MQWMWCDLPNLQPVIQKLVRLMTKKKSKADMLYSTEYRQSWDITMLVSKHHFIGKIERKKAFKMAYSAVTA